MKIFTFGLLILIELIAYPSLALPPSEDIPEEILRTEIILSGRSPIDGQPLTAAEYTNLEAQLAKGSYRPELSSDVQYIIFLLEIRKLLKTFTPF
jgi:hypothetical protein